MYLQWRNGNPEFIKISPTNLIIVFPDVANFVPMLQKDLLVKTNQHTIVMNSLARDHASAKRDGPSTYALIFQAIYQSCQRQKRQGINSVLRTS